MLINRKKNLGLFINYLFYNNRIYIDKRDICEYFNFYFINVGLSLVV